MDEKAKAQLQQVEIQYMTRAMLVGYIRHNALPVDSRLYPDLFKLRVAVQEAVDDEDGYVKRLAKHKEDLEMDLLLGEMNPGLYEQELPESVSRANTGPVEEASGPISPPRVKETVKERQARLSRQQDTRVEGLRRDMISTGEHGDTQDTLDDL